VEIVLKKNNGTNLLAGEQILPVNNLAHLLFKLIGGAGRYPLSYEKFNLSSIKQLVGGEYPYETLELKHDDDSKDLGGYHRKFVQV